MKKRAFILAVGLLSGVLATSCDSKAKKEAAPAAEEKKVEVKEVAAPNTLTQAEIDEGWVLLFDGTTSEGWRGYKKDHFPNGWKIVDGSIHCIGSGRGEAGAKEGGDII